ncbi:MAG: FadR/GntR family transcriptional regulator [Halanaerobacter sp.]
MNFKPIKEKKVYEKIIEQIEEMVSSGQLKKGDKLPSERELTERMEVSRASLREAFSALKMIGLIERRHGQGTFLKEDIDNNFLKPLSIIFMLEDNMGQELTELRRMIEISGVKYTAERATEEDLTKLRDIVDQMRENRGNIKVSQRADRRFHYTVAKATHNRLICNFLNSLSRVMDFYFADIMESIVAEENENDKFIRQHEELYQAISNHNAEKAQELMKAHLDWAESLVST